ncbi:restriction endonuclease subunit S [Rummeliibacillus pycnus]|uniref:restriction endonuclease subunit S n=1 Tax=Rummeliibacillus pycnus TaxID=101070 RepID=UPI0037C5EF5B
MPKKKHSLDEVVSHAIIDSEIPYELKQNSCWVKLESVCNYIQRGKSPKYVDFSNARVVSQKCVQWSGFDLSVARYIDETTLEKYTEERFLRKNDILWNSTGTGTIGRLAIIDSDLITPTVTDSHVTVIRVNPKLMDARYLFRWLSGPYIQNILENLWSGSTNQIELNLTSVKNERIPLLPLKEQQRIVEKVERLLGKIDEAKLLIDEAKKTFDLRKESVLINAFNGKLTKKWRFSNRSTPINEILDSLSKIKGSPCIVEIEENRNIPSTWRNVRLGEVVEINPKKLKVEYEDTQICSFIPMSAVDEVIGKILEIEERPFSKVKKGYTFFIEKDILFAKITPCMENGKFAIAKGLINGIGFGSTEFHVLRTSKWLNENYVHYFLRASKFRYEAKAEMTGAVGQQRVPKEFLKNYVFPLPPIEEQNEIVKILDKVFDNEEEINRILNLENTIDILKQSILSKAFKGQLGTNDSSDEDAIELLKSILKEQL